MEKAKNLKEIYNLFDPMKPLKGDYLKAFYVPPYREIRPRLFEEIKSSMRMSENPDKLLLIGYKGCGKSTELNKLCDDPEIKENFLVVKFSITDKTDIFDCDYRDLLMVISAEIYNSAKENKIKIKQEILDAIEDWMCDLSIIKTKIENGKIEISGRLDFIFATLGSWFSSEDSTRREMRQEITQKVSVLVGHINRMLGDIQKNRNVLVVIDDLDKLSSGSAIDIFHSNISALRQLNCKIVFTFPFALMLSPEWGQISKTFPQYIIPNITLRSRDGEKRENGYDIMREIFYKRAEANLITKEALDECVKYSGGVVYDFIRIVHGSANIAKVKHNDTIEKEDIKEVIVSMRNNEYTFLTKEHIEKLKEIRENKLARVEKESNIVRELIATLSVLRYNNGEIWDDVHPVIEQSLK